MKRLFFSVFALTLGVFAFVSCDEEGKIGNDDDNGRYMTVEEQQRAIQSSFEGIGDAIEFTELSKAIEVIGGVMNREIETMDLLQILTSPAVLEDTVLQNKIAQAVIMFSRDTIVLDLSPLYLSADLLIKDTVRIDTIRQQSEGGSAGFYVDTVYQTLFVLDNVKHDANCLQLNVFVDNHELVFKVNVRAGESVITYKEENDQKVIYLPKSAEVSITLDKELLASVNGQFTSDMSLYYEDVKGGDDIVRLDGKKFSVSGSIKVVSYELTGALNFDMSKGIDANLTVKYAQNELLSVSGKVDAVFEDLDLDDEAAILVWAQDAEKLKSISLNASMGGGKVAFKGAMDNPFKDEELATTLRSLMTPGATISKDKAEKAIEKLNAIVNIGFYFEGFNQPQAKMKFIYREKPTGSKGGEVDDDEENPFDAIGELLDGIGAYPVLTVHDKDGNLTDISFEDYFEKIDLSKFAEAVEGKFYQAFGPIMEMLEKDEKK